MVKVATYNVENLFQRVKVLSGHDGSGNQEKLNRIGALENLIKRDQYDPDTKDQILLLAKELSDFIEIQEDRGKLFTGRGAQRRVSANGREDWDGAIAFKKADFDDVTRGNTARVVRELDADILGFVEVEGRQEIDNFRYSLLSQMDYAENMSIEGNDPRSIDVGVISRFPIQALRSHIFDRKRPTPSQRPTRIFSRDCLEIDIKISGRTLTLMMNHFKSKGYGAQAESDARRKGQAQHVHDILKRFDLSQDWVIVAGDLNDTPDSDPLRPLIETPNLVDVFDAAGTPAADRWTYSYRGAKDQIDYLLVSRPLANLVRRVGVERRGVFNLSKLTGGAESSFPSVTKQSNAASDHGAVWAEFGIEP